MNETKSEERINERGRNLGEGECKRKGREKGKIKRKLEKTEKK